MMRTNKLNREKELTLRIEDQKVKSGNDQFLNIHMYVKLVGTKEPYKHF